ncbi:phosphate acyltransferase [Helicobacter pylori]|uniref:phosphate acyltransferase n=1 Tax=Helicobacter pylori TaxID=210 RepID=UPI0018A6CBCC|nr:phosphate acyltransferase [Helicobacter pylori]
MQGFMQSLWIYPEDTEVLGVACKSLLKALKPRYQKIALFSPIRPYDGGCEGFLRCEGLNPLEFHSAIDKQKALELASVAQEELLFETILKRYDELQTTHDFVINLGYAPDFFLNALLDLNTTLAKHLNAPIVAVAQTSLERLKAMYSHILKKEAPFAVGLFTGEMLEKPNFLSASLCKGELEADLIESVLQTKSKITTPLAFQMSLEKKAKKQIKKVVLPESEDERILKAVHRLNAMGAVGLILLGDKEAKLAFEMCAYRIKKHIGAYMAVLKKVDAIIFTGGLGENYSALRESVCEGLENLGIALHKPTNDNPGNGLVDLSQPDSKVKVLRIPTDEELEIALQTKKVLEKTE